MKDMVVMTSDIIKQNFELKKENQVLKEELKKSQINRSALNNRIKHLEKTIEIYKRDEEKRIKEIVEKAVNQVTEILTEKHKKEVDKLQAKIKRLEARLNTDSTNSGTPTSKERIGKRTIQNNREKTGKSKGAQEKHQRVKLEYFKDEEITQTVEHTLDKCPNCSGHLTETNIVRSDIIDINITITKTRNNIHNYKCDKCKKKVSANNSLPRGVSYGENINSIGLSMMNETNTSLNKISSFFKGISNNEIKLCEGYLVKLQKRCSAKLEEFNKELKKQILSLDHVFWDDTVSKFGIEKPEEDYDEDDLEYIKKKKEDEKDIKTRQGIIRFYGDDRWALLIGHRRKNEKGIEADGILENLSENCIVMHDHVLLNYNDKYVYQNAECNEHTKRYLKNNMDIFPEHKWAKKMRELLINTNHDKQELISKNLNSFSKEQLDNIYNTYDEIISLAYKENETVNLAFVKDKADELNLIERLDKFKENHLLFAKNFSVEFTNNTAERGLRQVKRKFAVSFMFKNANRMKDYANILSYLETCYRNGISRFEASKRLVKGNPYTIEEIKSIFDDQKSKTTSSALLV